MGDNETARQDAHLLTVKEAKNIVKPVVEIMTDGEPRHGEDERERRRRTKVERISLKENSVCTAKDLQDLSHTMKMLNETLQDNIKQMKKARREALKEIQVQQTTEETTIERPKCSLVLVHVRVVFLKLGEIDTIKEHFTADAFVQARWREPNLDGKTEQEVAEMDLEKLWNPKLCFDNGVNEIKETVWMTVAFSGSGEASVLEKRRVQGTFFENMELRQFPFDTQDLTISLRSERSEAEVNLMEDESEVSGINVQSFVDEQEWQLHNHADTWKRFSTTEYVNCRFRYPIISNSCQVVRRSGYFVWNILVVMIFLCSLAFATYTVDTNKPQNRLQLSFTLVLTTIAFKFVVNQSLPKIPYLTYLDKYVLFSMTLLVVICIWHSIVPLLLYDEYMARLADKVALIVIAAIYVLFHIIFFLIIYCQAFSKRWFLTEKDKRHQAKLKRANRKRAILPVPKVPIL